MTIKQLILILLFFGFFGCSNHQRETYPEHKWITKEVTLDNGNKSNGNVDLGYIDFKHRKDFPWCFQLLICVDSTKLDIDGLPTENELKFLRKVEKAYDDSLKRMTTAHHIGSVLNKDLYEVYWYLPEHGKVSSFLSRITIMQTDARVNGTYHLKNDNPIFRGNGYAIIEDPQWKNALRLLEN